MTFINSYARALYQKQLAANTENGAEKTLSKDKDTARVIARNEYRCEEIAEFNSDLARYYDRGLNPPRELLEQIYERG